MATFRARVSAIATLLSFANAACVETIPPPPRPTQEAVPQNVRLLPEVSGKGRVVIDATNEPAAVDEIVGSEARFAYGQRGSYYSEGEIAKPICASTPCTANLDYGQHLLRFKAINDEMMFGRGTVSVDASDTAFLHTMGGYKNGGATHGTGTALLGFGFLGATVGGALIFAGALRNTSRDENNPGAGLITGGEVTLAIGLGVMVLGIVLAQVDHPTYQDGSSQQFPIERHGAPVVPATPNPPSPAATARPVTGESL